MKNLASFTNHRKLFKDTEWGQLEIAPDELIIANRNNFIGDFNIRRSSRSLGAEGRVDLLNVIDKQEAYLDHSDAYIYISSPVTDEFTSHFLYRLGLIEYNPLFNRKRTTFVRVFKNRGCYNEFKKMVDDKKFLGA